MKKRTQLAEMNLRKIMAENEIKVLHQTYYPPVEGIILTIEYTDKNIDKLVEKISRLANYRIEKGKDNINVLLYQNSNIN